MKSFRASDVSRGRSHLFEYSGAMLMASANRCIDHCVFSVGVTAYGFEKILLDAVLRPARKAPLDLLPVPKSFRQILPQCTITKLPNYRHNKQSEAALFDAALKRLEFIDKHYP